MAAAGPPAAWALRTSHAPAVVELAGAVPLGVAVYGAVIWLIHRRVIFDLMTLLRQSVRVGRARRLGAGGGGGVLGPWPPSPPPRAPWSAPPAGGGWPRRTTSRRSTSRR